jgi:hypothetical protein
MAKMAARQALTPWAFIIRDTFSLFIFGSPFQSIIIFGAAPNFGLTGASHAALSL